MPTGPTQEQFLGEFDQTAALEGGYCNSDMAMMLSMAVTRANINQKNAEQPITVPYEFDINYRTATDEEDHVDTTPEFSDSNDTSEDEMPMLEKVTHETPIYQQGEYISSQLGTTESEMLDRRNSDAWTRKRLEMYHNSDKIHLGGMEIPVSPAAHELQGTLGEINPNEVNIEQTYTILPDLLPSRLLGNNCTC
jgi:hypothetical protein